MNLMLILRSSLGVQQPFAAHLLSLEEDLSLWITVENGDFDKVEEADIKQTQEFSVLCSSFFGLVFFGVFYCFFGWLVCLGFFFVFWGFFGLLFFLLGRVRDGVQQPYFGPDSLQELYSTWIQNLSKASGAVFL